MLQVLVVITEVGSFRDDMEANDAIGGWGREVLLAQAWMERFRV